MDDKQKDHLIKSVKFWQRNPLAWVSDKFGDGVKLSTQQKEFFVELGKLVNAKFKASEHPDDLTEQERIYAGKVGISIMAGQGVGKDFITAMTMLFFLDVFPYPKIPCTGVTGKHLRNVLWSECSKVMGMAKKVDPQDPQSPSLLESVFEWQTERIFHKGIKNPGSRWFAEAVTVNPKATDDEQAKTLYGRHEDYMMVVVDEAAGVPEPVFGPLEGTLTGKVNIALMIFNPIRTKGYAIDSHGKYRDKWLCLRWNAEESELVTKEHLAKMAAYGKDSNTYRVKVLGLPPLAEDNSLIPWEWIEDAVNREFDVDVNAPTMCGGDVGGGGDRSVFIARNSGVVDLPIYNSDKDTMKVAEWIGQEMVKCDGSVVFVDIVGLGRGVYDKLRLDRVNARPADSRGTPTNKERFYNSRAEMYWKLREQFEHKLISIPDHEDMKNELGAIKYDPDQKNKIEDKKQIRKRLGKSPDIADALAMSYFRPDTLYRKGGGKGNNRKKFDSEGVYTR